jgi:cytochrome c-type biogenesis protein CcmH
VASFCRFLRNSLGVACLLLGGAASAVTLEARLPSEAQERQAVALFKEVRCMTCAGESVYDSRSRLAHDMRTLIRKRVAAGDDPERILSDLAARYGDGIRMAPPSDAGAALLWIAPLLFAGAGGTVAYRLLRKKG